MNPLPNNVLGLIEELEGLYPPRCYAPGSTTLEEHLIYAGKVALVARLRERYEAADRRSRENLPKVL